MKAQERTLAAVALAVLCSAAVRAETDTVLVCYSTNVMRFAVEDGVWSGQADFAHKTNSYGGSAYNFSALASDGRRVFVGEAGGTSTRILELDLAGNYVRRLALVGTNIEYMCASQSGRWVYATVGISLNTPTNSAAVHRYDAVSGAGGVFIPNVGTNTAGEVLWRLQALRGVAADGRGRLWVSNRNSGQIFLFSEADGSYLGVISGLTSVQGLHYSARDGVVYGSSSTVTTFAVAEGTLQVSSYTIAGLNNRLGITQVQGRLCSGRWDTRDVSTYDLGLLTYAVAAEVPIYSRQLITLPRAPLRPAFGQLLVSETLSNRVSKLSVDTGYYVEKGGTFAGAPGALYGGVPLRSPRGLAAFSNTVYLAEGVEGGRVLQFNKWGTFKRVLFDFSQSAYSNCVPAALALALDGQALYVSDAHTLFIAGNDVAWANVPTNGYYTVNSYGETVYKIEVPSRAVSVFADSSSLASGNLLLEPRSLAVDANSNVYCSAWYNKSTSLSNGSGSVYRFDSAGVRQASVGAQNPSVCYYDPVGVYVPAATNALIAGPGIVHTAFGAEDFWWTAAGGDLSVRPKLLDQGSWRDYLDVEVVDGRMWFTDPEFGTLWRRTGEASREAALTGLFTPTYLAYSPETGPEPPPAGSLLSVR